MNQYLQFNNTFGTCQLKEYLLFWKRVSKVAKPYLRSESSVCFFTAITRTVFGNEKPLSPKVFSWIDGAQEFFFPFLFFKHVLSSILTIINFYPLKVYLNRNGTEKSLRVLKPLGGGKRELTCLGELQTPCYICSAMPTSRHHDGSLGVW